MISINKINWTLITTEDESTWPINIKKNILIAYPWNELKLEYLIIYNPTLYVVREYDEHRERLFSKVYCRQNHDILNNVEIVKWAILDLGD